MVVEDGAAEKAGIKAGDVITKIDDSAIKTGTDLQEQVARHRPGDQVLITLLRDGKKMTVRATLTNREGGTGFISPEDKASVLGATFEELSDKQKAQLGINYGLQVKNLKNGKLKSAGIPTDFIILKANNRSIRTEEDLNDVVRHASAAPERDRVLFITGCTPQGRIRYFAIDLAE